METYVSYDDAYELGYDDGYHGECDENPFDDDLLYEAYEQGFSDGFASAGYKCTHD